MANCENCGKPGFDNTKGKGECQFCGYHIITSKELPEISLVFCEGCGCTLSAPCPTHLEKQQRKVNFNTK